jgi:starch synthase (maltosyl-transferring)
MAKTVSAQEELTTKQGAEKAQPSEINKTGISAQEPVFSSRVVIEGVQPQVDGGLFPSKKVISEPVSVTAFIHCDGHNVIAAQLLYRRAGDKSWNQSRMFLKDSGIDLWFGQFGGTDLGLHEFAIEAWVDNFGNWRRDTRKKHEAGQDISVEIKEGAALLLDAAEQVKQTLPKDDHLHSVKLQNYANALKQTQHDADLYSILADEHLEDLMFRFAKRDLVCKLPKPLHVVLDPIRALYGAWYELFPRSAGTKEGVHGTFKDVVTRLPYIKEMGFDVVYFPPIHPIGTTARKGPNNSLKAGSGDVGSPWAIGAKEGGHKSILSDLGSVADFEYLVEEAQNLGIDIALDIAYQCSPDHPYVKEHPDWFYHRPDGSIKCAENPPKRYEDIYPINFECDDWKNLWAELKSVIDFWLDHGVTIFRVDNPHTKPYPFWEWMIAEVKKTHPEAIFLAEAFSRPKVMKYLAKIGFTQSYSYFTWRLGKSEITEYFTELYKTDVANYLRPNLFANTPDILTHFLQHGGKPAFTIRVALAATIGATYGIYGPTFELCVGASHNNSEEYLDSEKYQLRHWDLKAGHSISEFIARLNRIRRENPALHNNESIRFHDIQNEGLLAFSKQSHDGKNIILTVINLDPYQTQEGMVHVPMHELDLHGTFEAHDLVTNARYSWSSEWNYVRLDPYICPVHVFRLQNYGSH